MSKEERYVYCFEQYDGDSYIYDFKTDDRIEYLDTCADILNEKEKKIQELEQQLAEKENEIGNLHYKTTMKNMDYYIEGAIAELEKIREKIRASEFNYNGSIDCYESDINDIIDQRIKELRGKKLILNIY